MVTCSKYLHINKCSSGPCWAPTHLKVHVTHSKKSTWKLSLQKKNKLRAVQENFSARHVTFGITLSGKSLVSNNFWRTTEDKGLTYYLVQSQSVPESSPQEQVYCAYSAGDGILSLVSHVHSHARKSGEVQQCFVYEDCILFEYQT